MDANLTTLPNFTKESLAFERSLWTNGSVLDDAWYSVEASTSTAPPGTLLKVERSTNTSLYTLPPGTALSRFIYQSKTFNGSLVPVSAYVLWPHNARSTADGYQVVAWSHGTSGLGPNCAPSHIKNLWQHYLAPFQLALQGYVVVATDYAGLGVSKDGAGKNITHEYLTSPSHANDVFYSIEAAQAAFPPLSKHFVIAGHSQGGGSAWAAAQRQAIEPVSGYLGSVAISPITNVIKLPEPTKSILGLLITPSIQSIFPEFNPSDVLTPDGEEKLALVQEVGGNTATTLSLLTGFQPMKPNWTENRYVQQYQQLTENGGKAISGPLLVIHGEDDPLLDYNLTTAAVERTQNLEPKASIEYLRIPGTSHNGATTSCQWLWTDWITRRFQGVPAQEGTQSRELQAAVPDSFYQIELNWWIAPATVSYETP